MARKQSRTRPNLPEETLRRARRQARGQQEAEKAPAGSAPAHTHPPQKAEAHLKKVTVEDLANEYAYVVTDLRNMGLLAAALFLFLVVLALIL